MFVFCPFIKAVDADSGIWGPTVWKAPTSSARYFSVCMYVLFFACMCRHGGSARIWYGNLKLWRHDYRVSGLVWKKMVCCGRTETSNPSHQTQNSSPKLIQHPRVQRECILWQGSVIVTVFLTVSENKTDASVLLLVTETDRGHVIICHSRMFAEVLPHLFSLLVLLKKGSPKLWFHIPTTTDYQSLRRNSVWENNRGIRENNNFLFIPSDVGVFVVAWQLT